MAVSSAILLGMAAGATAAAQAQVANSSCDSFLPAPRHVNGKPVGPASCRMIEAQGTIGDRPSVRIDIGLDGAVEGYLTKTGDYKEYLTNVPDLVFQQTADPGPIYLAVAAYRRDHGAGMSIVLPADRSAWNGKAFVTAHGRGVSFKQGNLRVWDKNLEPANLARGLDAYELQMVAQGFAVVKTRRTSAEGLGEILATLEDGSTVDYAAFNDTARYIIDFAAVARRVIEQRLGLAPSRTYLYGHSAGARIGRGINYTGGLNQSDGRAIFDGFLLDDAAAGGWLPVVMKDGKDISFATAADKAAMMPQLEIAHQMYNNIWPSRKPAYMSSSYLENKRNNARILTEKGLTAKFRTYEVRNISHNGRGGGLELSSMMDRFIGMLDTWVDRGTAPPPSRSDWPAIGDVDRDGVVELPALDFPAAACPLGVFYPPTSTAGTTTIAAFTGKGLEPLDRGQVFVDMNRSGVWDYRETPTQAWRRLGLLSATEQLTREKYVACIKTAAERLRADGFISEATAATFLQQAATADLDPKDPVAPPPRR